jgi:hypothetical protein
MRYRTQCQNFTNFSKERATYNLTNLSIEAAFAIEPSVKIEQTLGCCISEYNLQQLNTCNNNCNFDKIHSLIYHFAK